MPMATKKRKQRTDTWEADPPRSNIERVIGMLSTHGVNFQGGTGGVPEMTPSDFAGALAGLKDPIAEGIIPAMLGDQAAKGRLGYALHEWGWNHWRAKRRQQEISEPLHARMAGAATHCYVERKVWPKRYLFRKIGVGQERWDKLEPHFRDMTSKLHIAEQALAWHLKQKFPSRALDLGTENP